MNSKTKREIVRLFRQTFAQLFSSSRMPEPFASAIKRAEEWALKDLQKRLQKEPLSPEKLEELRATLQGGVPIELQNQIRNLLKQALKALPSAPPGARPKLTEKERKEVPKLIAKYVEDGKTSAEAVALVAKDKKVSARTIKRAWKDARSQKGVEQ